MAKTNTKANTGSEAADALSVEFPIAKDETAEIEFPIRFHAGDALTDAQAANLNAFYLSRFKGNYRSYTDRGEKTFSVDDVLSAWPQYEPGAPREAGIGKTVRSEAAERVARLLVERSGKKWPFASKNGLSKEEAEAARDAITERVLTSTKPETVALLDDTIAQVQAERAERAAERKAAGSKLPVAEAAELDI